MKTPNQIVRNLQDRFIWEADRKIDTFHVMSNEGVVMGDCDDFATRIAYDYANQSWIRFWWLLVTFQMVFFIVNSPVGDKHLVLWIRGIGYTDNWKKEFTDTIEPHSKPFRWFPFPYPVFWPVVAFKLLLGKFISH